MDYPVAGTAPLLSRLGWIREHLQIFTIDHDTIRAATVMERFPPCYRYLPYSPLASYSASLASACASAAVPRAISAGAAYSSGRWLTPPRQGMNSIATGAIRDMKSES